MESQKIKNIILKINYLLKEEYFKGYNEKYKVNVSDYEKHEFIIDAFTHGGCALYGEFLYSIFKDYGATLVSSGDHILIKIDESFYDVTGLNNDPIQNGYLPFDMETETGQEQFEFYKDVVCGLYSSGRKEKFAKFIGIFDNIREQIKKDVKKLNSGNILVKKPYN